jgi:plastocyanin
VHNLRGIASGLLAAASACSAADFNARVTDGTGTPLRDAVVYLLPAGGARLDGPAPRVVIEQRDREFVPFVTAIRTGTAVTFPNRDQILHHVYSFAPTKTFQIKLYEGDPPSPVVFDKPGVVALGCNIHDWMQAYILVIDTPHFAVTDARGAVHIAGLRGGDYEARAWHPHASGEWRQWQHLDDAERATVAVTLATHAPGRKPKPPPDPTKYQ